MRMPATERFLDTNVLLYLLSGDSDHADKAEREVAKGGVVSVQVLNEFAAAAIRKLRMQIAEVREVLDAVRASCDCVPMTIETHEIGLELAEKHRLPVYDAMIVASAQLAGCRVLVSEDFSEGQRFRQLVVRNPFR